MPSATNSGLLLLPADARPARPRRWSSGQVISRTGRYKVFPVVGCALATVVMFLLSTMSSGTSQATVTVYMVLLGASFGLTIGTLVLAVQNVVHRSELGVATSSVTFFRSIGGAVGVALFGALFNRLLRDRIGTSVALGEGSSFSPESIRGLPAATHATYVDGFADSLTTVFLCAVPFVFLAFVLITLLKETPLRSSVHAVDHGRELAAASASGTEPESFASPFH